MYKIQIFALRAPDVNFYQVFNSPLDESIVVDIPGMMNGRICPKKNGLSSEKIILSQSRSKFSFVQMNLFSTCFLDN